MAAPTLAPALGLVDAAGVPISATNPLSVSLVAGGGGTAISIADGADVTQGSLADSSSALTVNGLLKAIKALLGAPLAVTGSFYQATQPVSGSLTVSGSVSVSNFPATQLVSAIALPLPDGAATAAKQPALGTAGISSADVLSIQGVEDGTPVPISGSVVCFPGDTFAVTGTITASQGAAAAATAPWSAQLSDGAAAYTGAKTGQLPTTLGVKSGGQALGVAVQQDNYTTVLTGTTAGTQVFNGACCLRQIVILTGATSAVVSISDGSGSAGTAWDIDASSRGVINLNVKMFFGIWVAISGGSPKVLITKD